MKYCAACNSKAQIHECELVAEQFLTREALQYLDQAGYRIVKLQQIDEIEDHGNTIELQTPLYTITHEVVSR